MTVTASPATSARLEDVRKRLAELRRRKNAARTS